MEQGAWAKIVKGAGIMKIVQGSREHSYEKGPEKNNKGARVEKCKGARTPLTEPQH